ncbi:MAG: hypothetical protein IT366_24690 [Candidatus Hydrogenedentes bacterium]|nr:hypothetical protein [Candidatus Hydrogenedentota bacterium]
MASSAKLPKLEVVWLPRHLFGIRCVLPKDEREITACVDSHSGGFTVFEMDKWLVEGDPPEPFFAQGMPLEEAERIARRELLSFILRQRGILAKPEPRETVRIRLIHHPYWVYYFDGGGYVDIRVLDAVTGERGGGKAKRAVLNAFARKAEESTHQEIGVSGQ